MDVKGGKGGELEKQQVVGHLPVDGSQETAYRQRLKIQKRRWKPWVKL